MERFAFGFCVRAALLAGAIASCDSPSSSATGDSGTDGSPPPNGANGAQADSGTSVPTIYEAGADVGAPRDAGASDTGATPFGVQAASAETFLNSIGLNVHLDSDGSTMPVATMTALVNYVGARLIRPGDGTGSAFLSDYQALLGGIPNGKGKGLWEIGSGKTYTTATLSSSFLPGAVTLAQSGQLLGFDGPNEPSNWTLTFNGATGGGQSGADWTPVELEQAALYAAVQANAAIKGYPVYNASGIGGEQQDVGLQWQTIPDGGFPVPQGTVNYDLANLHNYIQGSSPNIVWNIFDDTSANLPFTSCSAPVWASWYYQEYGDITGAWWTGCCHTPGFPGYTLSQLGALPRSTTETGWVDGNPDQLTQAAYTVAAYLTGFARGWANVFIYELEEQGDGYGLVTASPAFAYKTAATHMHNFTTILADTTQFSPGALNYTIPSEPPSVHDLLLQKSNGSFELVVWDDQAPASATNHSVGVNLGGSHGTVNVYDPTVGTSPINTYSNASSVMLTTSYHSFIVEVMN